MLKVIQSTKKIKAMNRRNFIKIIGAAGTAATAAACTSELKPNAVSVIPDGAMTYRKNKDGEEISLLGYGCMRLPVKMSETGEKTKEIDQEMVNELVDYAIEHGVNYFDTAPMYHGGMSEVAMGIALARHPRESWQIATKMSTQRIFDRDKALEMYHNSFKYLQVDYIDYYLLHSVGGRDGMDTFNKRFIDTGMLDFLLAEREAGRIRHLGFSFHGDVKVFDYLLSINDRCKWDFVQIQMNYVDWHYAEDNLSRNINAEFLYGKLEALGIPVVIMEPLLGGSLANVSDSAVERMLSREPDRSVASWAFRFCGTYPGVMTVLSGMTYMEHLKDNLKTFSPFKPLSEDELKMLEQIAGEYANYPLVPCTGCRYCMPCPYGIDIPAIFTHYNKCVKAGDIAEEVGDKHWKKARRAFLVGYDRSVPRLAQASHCIGCGQCTDSCPQQIAIPKQLQHIDRYVEKLKKNGVETRRKKTE
jgi:Predicted oxidoreductases of the aldo/keto reductase family